MGEGERRSSKLGVGGEREGARVGRHAGVRKGGGEEGQGVEKRARIGGVGGGGGGRR